MSLERKQAKKTPLDPSSAQRENNFTNKVPLDPKSIKMKSSSSHHDDASSDKLRKQTLSPP